MLHFGTHGQQLVHFVLCKAEAERERIMQHIEAAAEAMWKDGSCAEWTSEAEWSVKATAREVNGPMLAFLAKECGFHDEACVDFFRWGAKLFGRLPKSGNGVPIPPDWSWDPGTILQDREARNRKVGHSSGAHFCYLLRSVFLCKVLQKLRDDLFAEELFDLSSKEVEKGRVLRPSAASPSRCCVCQAGSRGRSRYQSYPWRK